MCLLFYDLILHTAACIAMQLVTPSQAHCLESWVFYNALWRLLNIFNFNCLQIFTFYNIHLLEADIFLLSPHCLAVTIQAPCKHPIVVIFFSHKYWTSVNEGQQNKCWIVTFSSCTYKIIKLPWVKTENIISILRLFHLKRLWLHHTISCSSPKNSFKYVHVFNTGCIRYRSSCSYISSNAILL